MQKMTSAGIAVDKMRLLREQSTSINEHTATYSIEEKRRRILDVLFSEPDRGDIPNALPGEGEDAASALSGLAEGEHTVNLDG